MILLSRPSANLSLCQWDTFGRTDMKAGSATLRDVLGTQRGLQVIK